MIFRKPCVWKYINKEKIVFWNKKYLKVVIKWDKIRFWALYISEKYNVWLKVLQELYFF